MTTTIRVTTNQRRIIINAFNDRIRKLGIIASKSEEASIRAEAQYEQAVLQQVKEALYI